MSKMLYSLLRDLHLYLGLFISPFLVLFAVTVFYFNHGRAPVRPQIQSEKHAIQVPLGIGEAQGTERLVQAKEILKQLRITGEVNFIRYVAEEHRLIIPVLKPGVETRVEVEIEAGSAIVARRAMTAWETLTLLHKMPGPHNAAIRGNWFWTRAWTSLADSTVYLIFFLTITGVYLWAALKAERGIGAVLLCSGAASLIGVTYAIIA